MDDRRQPEGRAWSTRTHVPVNLELPELSPGLEFATVLQWRRQEGDSVVAGEPLLEVEADKVTVEIPAPVAGVLSSIAALEGDEIKVGGVLAVIDVA